MYQSLLERARPATIIDVIEVSEPITGERNIAMTETTQFFNLRNHVRDLMRAEAKRTQEIAEHEIRRFE